MPSAPASNAGSISPGVPKLARHLHGEAVARNRRQALPLGIFRMQNVLFRQSPAESRDGRGRAIRIDKHLAQDAVHGQQVARVNMRGAPEAPPQGLEFSCPRFHDHFEDVPCGGSLVGAHQALQRYRQPDENLTMTAAGGQQIERRPVIPRHRAVRGQDGQLPLMDQIGIDGYARGGLGHPAEEMMRPRLGASVAPGPSPKGPLQSLRKLPGAVSCSTRASTSSRARSLTASTANALTLCSRCSCTCTIITLAVPRTLARSACRQPMGRLRERGWCRPARPPMVPGG
jgi:hypothetical protein